MLKNNENNILAFSKFLKMLDLFSKIVKEDWVKSIVLCLLVEVKMKT